MKELDIIDKEIERLVNLKETIRVCESIAQDDPDVAMCSSSYFHEHIANREPRKAGQVMFVISDELAHFLWD